MKNLSLVIAFLAVSSLAFSQVTISPTNFDQDTPVTIRFDASLSDPDGTAGLVGASKVYMHSGAMIGGPRSEDWTYVVGNWGADDGVGEMTNVGGDVWEITITPSSYYATAGEVIFRLGMVFRSADGNSVGKNQDGSGNIYIRVFGAVQDRAVDSVSLVDLYNYTGGSSWTNATNWNAIPMDTWNGVTVTAGRVTNVALANNNLIGSLPATIGDMDALITLDLSLNQLSGDVPASMVGMGSLSELYIDDNQFSSLPDFSSNTSLTLLGVANNYFDFYDLEPNVGQPYSISYISQFEYGYNQLRGIFDGQSITIDTDPGGTSNSYQWFKDGIIISGATNQSLDVLGTDVTGEAIYHCEVMNSNVSGLTLTSAPIIVRKSTTTLESDSLALVALYNSTDGANWIANENWLTGPVDVWQGVSANAGRVDTLNLDGIGLSGIIPFEIGDLTNLSYLNLGRNNLYGELPASIGNLINLSTLYLYLNALSGPLPAEIGNLTNLVELDLAPNQFSGTIPAEIGNLTNLVTLWLNNNQFTGDVPASFANLVNLQNLYLMGNQLTGLPNLSGITGWVTFRVENNNLTFEDLEPNAGITASNTLALFPQNEISVGGTQIIAPGENASFDATIGGSANTYSWFKDGFFTGISSSNYDVIAASLADQGYYQGKITNSFFPGDTLFTETTALYVASNNRIADSLVLVDIYNNMGGLSWYDQSNWLSTNIDSWFGVVISNGRVSEINLNNNNLNGNFPPTFYELTALENVFLWQNPGLTGTISADIQYLTSLQRFSISDCNISGPIPAEFSLIPGLLEISASRNPINSALPAEIFNISSMESFFMDGAGITGSIAEAGKWTNLSYFSLTDNNLSGQIPDLTGLDNLIRLRLQNNNLSGTFPEANWQLPSLLELNIGYNPNLVVTIPSNMGSLNFEVLNLSAITPIRGPFPSDVFNMTNLVSLELGGNYFTGTIGPEIGNLTNLEWLWIWDNLLEGDFPTEVTNLTNIIGLGIAGNNITSFPDISGFPNLQYLELAWNKLGFKDLLPYTSLGLANFRYDNQQRKESQFLTVAEGGDLPLSNPLDGVGNEYLWLHNLDTLSSETNRDFNITGATIDDLGGYFAWVTNPALPDLILATPYYNVAFEGDPKAFYVDNRPGALTDFTSFYAGFYGTNDGDTLYVAGSEIPYNIGGIRLETPKVIIGPGYFLDSNSETQQNKSNATLEQYFHIAPGAEGSVIYGMELNGYRVDVHNVFSHMPTSISNIKLIGNKINQLNFSHTASNIELAGNFINLLIFNSTSLERTLWRTYDDFNIHNNIIDSVATNFARISADHNSLSNVDFSNNTIAYISDSIQNVALTSNIIGVNNSVSSTETSNLVGDYSSGVFVNGSGTFSLDSDFQLSSGSAAIGAGESGTDAGHSGGDTPYILSGLPPVPNVFLIDPLERIRFTASAKQNSNTTANIQQLNYWINNNGTVVDKGQLSVDPATSVNKTFRPKLSKVDPGGTYDLYIQAKAADGTKGLKQYMPFTATTVNASGAVTTSGGTNVTAGNVYLFEINAEATAFDTLSTVVENGGFSFTNIVEGDYLAMAFADSTIHPNELPTYYERTTFWEESDTLLIDQNVPSFAIQLINEPPVTEGTGAISGVLDEEFDENEGGRVEAKKRVEGAGVSVRRRSRQGRSEEDELELVAYVYTNENGEFNFNKLEDDEYFINIQYPGYPMDSTSTLSIILGQGGGDRAEVSALVAEGKITVSVVEITGVSRFQEDISISIFPNPTANILNIAKTNGAFVAGEVSLIDINGRTVQRTTLSGNSTTLDVKELPLGVYVLKVVEEGEVVSTARIIKTEKEL